MYPCGKKKFEKIENTIVNNIPNIPISPKLI